MSVALTDPDRYFTREEYRRWCVDQTRGRYERIDGRIIAMASERIIHVRVKSAIWLAFRRAISDAGVPCEALADGVTVEVGDSDYEPDALVNCGANLAGDAIAASDPVIIVEVLSPGTASTDTGAKLTDYFQLPSVAHYLVVNPQRRVVTHHSRAADGIQTRIIGSGSLAMDPPGITITVDEIFEVT